jgi:hypothetical protein
MVDAHLLPAFGGVRVEDVTPEATEHWRAPLDAGRGRGRRPLSNRTKNKLVTVLHGIFERARKVYGLPANPVASVERLRARFGGITRNPYKSRTDAEGNRRLQIGWRPEFAASERAATRSSRAGRSRLSRSVRRRRRRS